MPDLYGHQKATDNWTTTGSAESVMAQLVGTGEAYGGRLATTQDGSVQMHFGSRSGFRFWGFLAPTGMRPVVLVLSTVEEAPDRVRVTVTGIGDPGWYVTENKSWSERLFGKAFRRLFDALRKRSPPIES
jgi:hypothetical protein